VFERGLHRQAAGAVRVYEREVDVEQDGGHLRIV
jgi:hypothetical protein